MSTAHGEGEDSSEALTQGEAASAESARTRARRARRHGDFCRQELENRDALRLAHTLLRDAVNAATAELKIAYRCRTPTSSLAVRALSLLYPLAQRWPRLEALSMSVSNAAVLEAFSFATWSR